MNTEATALSVQIGGHTMYVDPADNRAQHLVKMGGTFNPLSVVIWRRTLTLDSWDLIVDVGANYGEMLLEIDDASKAATVAFEANHLLIPFLERSLKEANRAVTLVPFAVSDSVGTLVLHLDETWSGTSSVVAPPSTAEGHTIRDVQVAATTLDAYFASSTARRVCVKIDVEGAEELVLNGGRHFFANAENCAVMMEIAHLPKEFIEKLAREWRLYLMDRRSNAFVRIDTAMVTCLESMDWHYLQDAVLLSPSSALTLSHSDRFVGLSALAACMIDLSHALSDAQTRLAISELEARKRGEKLEEAAHADSAKEADVCALRHANTQLTQHVHNLQSEVTATRATLFYRLAHKVNRLLGRVK